MTFVLKDIGEASYKDKKIMYCDSNKVWDGLTVEDGRVEFFSINETSYWVAMRKLLKR